MKEHPGYEFRWLVRKEDWHCPNLIQTTEVQVLQYLKKTYHWEKVINSMMSRFTLNRYPEVTYEWVDVPKDIPTEYDHRVCKAE